MVIVNRTVFAGFGTHCNLFNFTGWIAAAPTYPAPPRIRNLFSTAAPPFAPPVDLNYSAPTSGKAGVWQGGFALTTDGTFLYFATGNGPVAKGFVQNTLERGPADGGAGLSTLDNALVKLGTNEEDGRLVVADYFQPWNFEERNPPDQDLGASGIALLDPGYFVGPSGERLALQAGKLSVVRTLVLLCVEHVIV